MHRRVIEGRKGYLCFFLRYSKAFDTVWHDGLWFKLWEMGVRGKMFGLGLSSRCMMSLRVLFFWREKILIRLI